MQLFLNNFASRLASPLASSATTMQIPAEDAVMLAGLGAGDHCLLTLVAVDPLGRETANEIVRVTGSAGGVLTIERGQEGTPTAEWSINSLIEARWTAGSAAALATALAGKVNIQPGYGLSQNSFTDDEKSKLSSMESSHFKGLFTGLSALAAAVSAPVDGDYADVDAGEGSEVVRYLWDSSDSTWVPQLGVSAQLTAAQIKTEYESNPDTNAFTDAEKAKLAGLQDGLAVGDLLLTLRDPGAGYVLPGATLLQANYPELFALIGLTGGTPADGASWVAKDAGFGAVGILGAAYGNGVWMAVGSTGHLARSTDGGATWTHFMHLTDSLNSVATDGAGNWLAGGNSGKLKYSIDDGITWYSATSNFGTAAIYSVGYGNGVWMIAGGSGKLYRSTNGPGGVFSAVTSNFGTSNIRGVSTDGAGVWIAAGYAGKIARSTNNGATWTLGSSGFGTDSIYSVETDGAGVWVAVGDVAKIARSTDNGATWTLVTSNYPAGGWIYGIGTDGTGIWVAAGNSGGWTRSTDNGATWAVGSPAFASDINDVAYGGGAWVVPGYSGNLSVSLPSYPYNSATEFKVPAVTAPEGATAYIRATA